MRPGASTASCHRNLNPPPEKKTAMNDMRILFCASEAVPYAKTGGLADVVGALPAALQELGCDVRIFMPLYRGVREKAEPLTLLPESPVISVGTRKPRAWFLEGRTSTGIPIYFLEKDEYFDRSHLYGTPHRSDYEDNAERFIAFSRAVHPLCSGIGWFPNVFHLHDWQTALVAAYHHFFRRYDPNFLNSGTVFTIHNLAYQGIFPRDRFSLTNLPPEAFSLQGMEFWGKCNFLKAGLVYADRLTTVSPRYSREIQGPELGCGLEGILQERSADLTGILNGIDTTVWNPATDPLLPARFQADNPEGKRSCKEALLAELEFPPESAELPLLGMIGRLAMQKGFDLLVSILPEIMTLPVTLVVLGTGDASIEANLRTAAENFPGRFKLISAFDEALSHRIEAGADIFLMPSRYEPCGLNQMYSLCYGTVPVVHATGGLEDSIVDVTENPGEGTGFKFRSYKPEAFFDAVKLAVKIFGDKERWSRIRGRAMACDFSWTRSAREYLELYRALPESRLSGRFDTGKETVTISVL